MNLRIAILAAWASTLALALAAPTGAFAQSTSNPIPGVDIIVKKKIGVRANQKAKAESGLPNNKTPKTKSSVQPDRRKGDSGSAL
jgi:hypothetical protein